MHEGERLRQAAAALQAIHEHGSLADLSDEIQCARRDHRQRELNRTIGEALYIDQLAGVLREHTGLPHATCAAAMRDAVRPPWATMAMDEIIRFGAKQSAEVWQ